MAKGSGTTRGGSARNPRGFGASVNSVNSLTPEQSRANWIKFERELSKASRQRDEMLEEYETEISRLTDPARIAEARKAQNQFYDESQAELQRLSEELNKKYPHY